MKNLKKKILGYYFSIQSALFYKMQWWFNIVTYLKNIIVYYELLKESQPYDGEHSMLIFLKIHLTRIKNYKLYHDRFVDDSIRIPKITRCLEILEIMIDDSYLEEAEKQLNLKYITKGEFVPIKGSDHFEYVDNLTEQEKSDNSKISKLSAEIHKNLKKELFDTLEGTYYSRSLLNKPFESYYDGTGIDTWWD
jgi:hypothetical protein